MLYALASGSAMHIYSLKAVRPIQTKTLHVSGRLYTGRLRRNLSDAYYYNSEQQGFPTLIKNIFRENTHIGWLVMITKTDPPEIYIRHMFEELGEIVTLWSDLNSQKPDLLSFDDIFPEILSDGVIGTGAENYFSLMNWLCDDEKCMYIIKGQNPEDDFSQIRSRLDNYLYKSAITVYENTPGSKKPRTGIDEQGVCFKAVCGPAFLAKFT